MKPYKIDTLSDKVDLEFILKKYQKYLLVKVRLLTGKYEGRMGIITDVIIHTSFAGPRIMFLVMVLKRDSMEYLNADSQSRQYWEPFYFEVIE